jgi:LuxR family maltose regulon positive regulatory protein
VAVLEARTEGWAAALQLAALSLQGRNDQTQFIAGFAGNDRFVVDYLADEVLNRQPGEVRRFLLDTSVLDRLTGSLCDAVTGRSDGKSMLESLERQNLFVVPLDDQRRWYRYHHLFADVLRTYLLDERARDVSGLHRRASDWYDQAADPEASVRHALAAGEMGLAAERIELAIPGLLRERREAVIRRWVDDLPRDVVRNRPVLAVGFIAGLLSSNQFDGIERRLRDVEQLLKAPDQDLVVVDAPEFSRLPALVEAHRAAISLVAKDLPGTLHHAERALGLAADDDHRTVASASALAGLASWASGDLEAAHRAYRVAADNLELAGYVADVLGCCITLVDLEITQGRLGKARDTSERALALAASTNSSLRGVADMYVALSRVCWERGDLVAVAECLRKADEVGDSAGLPQNPYRWRVMMACLREAAGDRAAAIALLNEAERVYVGDFAPNVRPIAAARARVLAAAGDLAGAKLWAREQDVSATDDLTYFREYDHLTLARVLLAEHSATNSDAALEDVTGLLARLLIAAQKGGRVGTVIETLVLKALAERAAGSIEPALATLAHAVHLAEREGHVRVFTHEGAPVAQLLEDLASRDQDHTFIRSLMCAFSTPGVAGEPFGDGVRGGTLFPEAQSLPSDRSGSPYGAQTLIDPLSNRELDVLRLLNSDLGGPEIARALHVSLSTVRTHTQHIYAKLSVTNRRSAVRRGHQLNLFTRVAQH